MPKENKSKSQLQNFNENILDTLLDIDWTQKKGVKKYKPEVEEFNKMLKTFAPVNASRNSQTIDLDNIKLTKKNQIQNKIKIEKMKCKIIKVLKKKLSEAKQKLLNKQKMDSRELKNSRLNFGRRNATKARKILLRKNNFKAQSVYKFGAERSPSLKKMSRKTSHFFPIIYRQTAKENPTFDIPKIGSFSRDRFKINSINRITPPRSKTPAVMSKWSNKITKNLASMNLDQNRDINVIPKSYCSPIVKKN